jgi:hypothetical protein
MVFIIDPDSGFSNFIVTGINRDKMHHYISVCFNFRSPLPEA